MEEEKQTWVLSADGASNVYTLKLNFQATNNRVEYEALLHGLELAKHLRVRHINVKAYSKLIVEQV